MFKNLKIKNYKIVFLALVALAVVFVARNYTLASTQGSSSVAKPTSQDTLRNGLVGWWTFDGADMTATLAKDKSGSGNDGTRFGTTTPVIGKIGQALRFDGSNATRINTPVMYVGGTFAFSAWFKFNQDAASAGINNNILGAANVGVAMYQHSANNNLYFYGSGGSQFISWLPTAKVWHHVACSVVGGNTTTCYGDGVLKTMGAGAGTFSITSTALSIGNSYTTGITGLSGMLDDIRLYNRALSATEIQALYKYGQNKMDSSQTAVPTAKNNLKTGLVGWWTFDGADVAGNSINDKSVSGVNGTKSGPSVTIGKIGQAMNFHGGSDSMTIPNSTLDDFGTGPMTVSLWVKFTSADSLSLIDNKTVGTNNPGFNIETTGGQPFFRLANGSAQDNTGVAPAINNGKWHQIVGIRNGARASIYIDGLYNSSAVTDVSSWNISSTQSIIVGAWAAGSGHQNFIGSMDDIRIYNRALSASEIQELYKSGGGKIDSSLQNTPTKGNNLKTGLVGWWTFDGADATINTTTDKSASGFNGTRNGTTTPYKGKIGQALRFGGALTDYVNVGNIGVSGDWTVSFWSKIFSRTAAIQYPFGFGGSSTGIYMAYVDGAGVGTFPWGFYDGSKIFNGPDIAVNKWYYLTVTHAGPTSTLYTNGVFSANTTTASISMTSLNFGKRSDNFFPLNGVMDDIRIYNRALSASEITELYRLGK